MFQSWGIWQSTNINHSSFFFTSLIFSVLLLYPLSHVFHYCSQEPLEVDLFFATHMKVWAVLYLDTCSFNFSIVPVVKDRSWDKMWKPLLGCFLRWLLELQCGQRKRRQMTTLESEQKENQIREYWSKPFKIKDLYLLHPSVLVLGQEGAGVFPMGKTPRPAQKLCSSHLLH